MNELRIYDRQGQPITLEEWSVKLGDDQYKRVAYWEQGDVVVSTVWLGLEHHFSFSEPEPDHPVAIFETMIFGGSMDQDQWRYATEEQALTGHAEVVTLVKSLLNLEGITPAAEPQTSTSTPDILLRLESGRNAAAHSPDRPDL